jgi:hypothetical protein
VIWIDAFATAQESDYLIHDGKTYRLIVNPMGQFFEKFPEKRPKTPLWSSSRWRDYVATFEIIQNELWVVEIKVKKPTKNLPAKKFDFGTDVNVIKDCLDGKDKMKIDWFTDILIIPRGEMIVPVRMDYASTYAHYKLIKIENGNYIKELEWTPMLYNEHRDKQYEIYKKTKSYKEKLKELDPDGKMSEEMSDEFIKMMFEVDLEKIFDEGM